MSLTLTVKISKFITDIFDEKKEAIKSSQVINETEVNELHGQNEREKGQKLTIEQRRKLR